MTLENAKVQLKMESVNSYMAATQTLSADEEEDMIWLKAVVRGSTKTLSQECLVKLLFSGSKINFQFQHSDDFVTLRSLSEVMQKMLNFS